MSARCPVPHTSTTGGPSPRVSVTSRTPFTTTSAITAPLFRTPMPVFGEDELGQPTRRDEGVRGADPFLHLGPFVGADRAVEPDGDPTVAAESVARRLRSRVGGHDGGGFVLGQLQADVLAGLIAEDEVLPVHAEAGMVAPLGDVDPLRLGQPADHLLQPFHLVHRHSYDRANSS